MASFFIGLFTVALILICISIILIVLMQRASSNASMGGAMGGGAAESAFGAESGNILTRWTIYAAVTFFIIAFGLYLSQMLHRKNGHAATGLLPEIKAVEPAAKKEAPGSLTEAPQATNE